MASTRKTAWLITNQSDQSTLPSVLATILRRNKWDVCQTQASESNYKTAFDARPRKTDAIFYLFRPQHNRWAEPTYRTMLCVASHFLEEAADEKCPIVIVSSSDVYGAVDELENPVTEQNDIRPQTLEAAAYAAIDDLAMAYHRGQGTDVRIIRPFETPAIPNGQISRLIQEVAKVEAGEKSKLVSIGRYHDQIDLLHTTDLIEAMISVARKGNPGSVYNCGYGYPITMQRILEMALEATGLEGVEIDARHGIIKDVKYASNERLSGDTGWKPQKTVEQAVGDAITFWRSIYGNPI
jgi:nucleoside-diphosphate-sugar epimerase